MAWSSSGYSEAFQKLCSLPHLLHAFQRAAAGKRRKIAVAAFEFQLMDHLLKLRDELISGSYAPGAYTHFLIHEPKRRKISAALFRDRVVHHALCSIIEPRFEKVFIPDNYANRVGKGTHRAIDRLQHFCRHYQYVLRCDIRQHFASIDHAILLDNLRTHIPEPDLMALNEKIIAGGCDVLADEYTMVWFPGDDLLAACRPRGLPIGNLTSQLWSNCYLHDFDLFIKRELGCKAYLRYVDDFALFANSKQQLWQWKKALQSRLAQLRLTIHEHKAQVAPAAQGVPWLGFVVYPDFRKIKARKAKHATRRLNQRYIAYCDGHISFAEFDASVQGWINHVRFADTWGLRRHVLRTFRIKPGDLRQKKSRAAMRRYQ